MHERTPTISPNVGSRSAKRFNDSFLVARAVAAIGESMKYIGVVLGLIVVVVRFYIGNQLERGLMYSVGGAVAGIVIAIPLYLLGILVSAQGQVLKASLDGAVHTSPFLDIEQKAKAMSLE
jgi:hypothetical protein